MRLTDRQIRIILLALIELSGKNGRHNKEIVNEALDILIKRVKKMEPTGGMKS